MKITSDKILFFDLDGTLIDTDYANWISYKMATKNALNLNQEGFEELLKHTGLDFIKFDPANAIRITRNSFDYEVLTYEAGDEIISKKQEFYSRCIHLTKKMEENVALLKRFSQTNKIILVSNAKKSRGLETLKYHQLDSYFHKMFFKEDNTSSNNKYENAIKTLGLNPQNIIAFEDNEKEIQKAREAGIEHINIKVEGENIKEIFGGIFKNSTFTALIYQNEQKKIRLEIDDDLLWDILNNKEDCKISVDESDYFFSSQTGNSLQKKGIRFRILKDGVKEFCFEYSHFLKFINIRGFYHKDYFSGGNWNIEGKIEHLIWSLKNDEGCKPSHKSYLSTACKRLKNILLNDLPEIKNRIEIDDLTVCIVPRAKEGFVYRKDQLLFRQIVSDVVNKLDGFEDGTKFMVRHTTTQTTHLKNAIIEGKSPYVGITKDTCYISDNVIGKNILLIDDVYTRGVGIDEDAIQALLDKGANNVWFYSIGKTYSYK